MSLKPRLSWTWWPKKFWGVTIKHKDDPNLEFDLTVWEEHPGEWSFNIDVFDSANSMCNTKPLASAEEAKITAEVTLLTYFKVIQQRLAQMEEEFVK